MIKLYSNKLNLSSFLFRYHPYYRYFSISTFKDINRDSFRSLKSSLFNKYFNKTYILGNPYHKFHSKSCILQSQDNSNDTNFSQIDDLAILNGHATPEATKRFIDLSNLKLHHLFQKSNLTINPIIHGPPNHQLFELSNENANTNIIHAIIVNRCNCIYVYNHYQSVIKGQNYIWSTDLMTELLNEEFGLCREEIVTVAGLGSIKRPSAILNRWKDAKERCKLQMIDILIVEVS